MVIGSGTCVVVAMFWALCAFDAVVHAAEPDRVSLREETVTWSTVKYATDAENGLVSGSLDNTAIVDRTFRARVLENGLPHAHLVGQSVRRRRGRGTGPEPL